MGYAEGTTVNVGRTKDELERLLTRYGADAFSYGYDQQQAIVAFRFQGTHVKFRLPLPTLEADEVKYTKTRMVRAPAARREQLEKEVRRRWRALLLVIKAKLEAVESGIVSFEQEFLAHIMLPDGSVVSDTALPALAQAYETGEMPKLLPGGE